MQRSWCRREFLPREAHPRLSAPLTVISYALVSLASVLTGSFRRHGGFARPLIGIGITVGLIALGLSVNNLASRNSAFIPLIWLQSIVPGVIAGWLLLRPERIRVPRHATAGVTAPAATTPTATTGKSEA